MIRYLTFLMIFFTSSLLPTESALSIAIDDKGSVYNVNRVHVEGASFDESMTVRQASISNAQMVAFSELTKYLKREDTSINENTISSAIKSFYIVDEYYNDNFYSVTIDFVFDKNIIMSLINGSDAMNYSDEIMDFGVVLHERKNLLDEYARFVGFLKKEDIDFSPLRMTSEDMEIIVKHVSGNRIYNKIKDLKLNGKMYIDN